MFVCALLLMLKLSVAAENLCNIAFFILMAGVIIKLIRYFIEKEYLGE